MKKYIAIALLSLLALATGAHAQQVSDAFRQACEAHLPANAVSVKAAAPGESMTPKWRMHKLEDPKTGIQCAKVTAVIVVPSSAGVANSVASLESTFARELEGRVWYGYSKTISRAVARELVRDWAPRVMTAYQASFYGSTQLASLDMPEN